MSRTHLAAICTFLCMATSASGETPWYKDPGTPMTLRTSGLVLQATLPRGWVVVGDEIMAPPALGPDCRAGVEFFRERQWDGFLVSVLASTPGRRTVLTIGGHPAVSNEFARDGDRITKVYIDLSGLQPGAGAIWTLVSVPTKEGGDCELQSLALVHSGRITRGE